MKKINLAITGCMGRMGQQLIKTSKKNKNFKLVSLTENRIINKKIIGIRPNLNNENAFKKANVIIDFTVPKCTLEVLKIASKLKKRVVIGTTGFNKKEENIYEVAFWGTFERMHGLDTILDSAIELGNEYKFYLIGNGSYFKHIKGRVEKEGIKNVFLTGYLSKNIKDDVNLYSYIIKSDVCLGAFSDTKKNNLVIPGKIVEAFLLGKPVITAKTNYIEKINGNFDLITLVNFDLKSFV